MRELIKDLKKDFFEAKDETYLNVLNYFNCLVIFVIFIACIIISLILCFLNLEILSFIITTLSIVYLILALKTRVFRLTGLMSYKLLFYLFGRYGKVVSKQDWKNIKKYWSKKHYRKACTKKSKGYCYFYSWAIANFLRDAQIMYCSIQIHGRPSGHSVIVKNNCVYDTNEIKHYDFDDYIKHQEAVIYKMFSEDEYRKATFFDDIRDGFVEWCAKNNVYCSPQ